MLARLHLGSPPSDGPASLYQCRKFKELLRNALKPLTGVSLLTVRDGDRMWVEAVYEEGDEVAGMKARQARHSAPGLWADIERMSCREVVR